MADAADHAADLQQAEIEHGLAALQRNIARAGEQETDEHGRVICCECEELIDPRRLEALPTAVRCTPCQEELEAGA